MPRPTLPIHAAADAICAGLRDHGRLVVQAPTGAGKSTQIPQLLLDRGLLGVGQALVLQPRRLPARLLAKRVAEERGVELGGEVGYQMRFDARASPATRILYITEGVLVRRLLADPELGGVSCILFDEFHERHVHGDVSLAVARGLQGSRRPDLRLVVMSATLSTDLVERYLEPAAVIRSEGRAFPVSVEHLPREPGAQEHIGDMAAAAFERLARRGVEGHILVFMPGVYEIQRTMAALRARPAARGCAILPLHGELPPAEQDAAVARSEKRKVIVTTNVAETSLTIEGVAAVIDSGLARMPRFDPRRGIDTLWIEKISQASADQRAGRAGRTAPGLCLRLWTEADHARRPAFAVPEIRRVDLSETLLALKAFGVRSPAAFPWLEAPDPAAVAHAERLLADLGAAGPDNDLTETGRRMLSFPVHPRYARMLLEAGELGCVGSVALIAAMTQERDLFVRSSGSSGTSGFVEAGDRSDFFPLMRAWEHAAERAFDERACGRAGIRAGAARRVAAVRDRFFAIARQEGLRVERAAPSEEAVRRCIFAGFSDQLARRTGPGSPSCAVLHGRRGTLGRDSCLGDDELFVASDINEIEGGGRGVVRLGLATAVEEAWLVALAPEACAATDEVSYDAERRRVVAVRRRRFRDLEVGRTTSQDVPRDRAAEVLAEGILAGAIRLESWDEHVGQWIARADCVAAWCPELGLAPFTEEDRRAVLEQLCWGSLSAKEVQEKPILPVLKAWYSQAHQDAIERLAPERLRLPSGRHAKIHYEAGAPPVLKARIQDLYDVKETPAVAGGTVRLLVHVLAPNNRPVQITDDLPGFWRNHYPRIRQELRQRYSKHEWR